MLRHGAVLLVLLTACLLFAACDGSPDPDDTKTILVKIGQAYHRFNATEKRPPNGLVEFSDYVPELRKDDTNAVAALLAPLRDGRIVLIWNADLSRDGDANDEFLLGFENDAAKNGGFVLRGGGFVEEVDAAAFKSLSEISTVTEKPRLDAVD